MRPWRPPPPDPPMLKIDENPSVFIICTSEKISNMIAQLRLVYKHNHDGIATQIKRLFLGTNILSII